MRIFTASLATETNTFAPIPTDLRSFQDAGLYPPSAHPSGPTLTTAPLWVLRQRAPGGLPQPVARITGGTVWFDGTDLAALPNERMRHMRGDRLGMIFQEPMTSLNPVYRVGDQLVEAFREHRAVGRGEAWRQAVAMLDLVGIPAARDRARSYPHELSGGMRQRVMIGMALICRPKLLIADEPTTALDVSNQAQILDLLLSLRREIGMAIMIITHDLGVVAEIADRVAVMYAGRIVETADVFSLFRSPRHPYTHALLRSIPRLDAEQDRLVAIEGTVAAPLERPSGCSFRDRCARAQSRCADAVPPLAALDRGHRARCFFPVAATEQATERA